MLKCITPLSKYNVVAGGCEEGFLKKYFYSKNKQKNLCVIFLLEQFGLVHKKSLHRNTTW